MSFAFLPLDDAAWHSFRLLWCSHVYSPTRLQPYFSEQEDSSLPFRIRTWLSCRMHFFAQCRLASLHLGVWPRIRVNRWVDDDFAPCSDHVHQCPVDFHQRFPVSGRVRYPSPECCAPVWRLLRLDGPLCQFCECPSRSGQDHRGHLSPDSTLAFSSWYILLSARIESDPSRVVKV